LTVGETVGATRWWRAGQMVAATRWWRWARWSGPPVVAILVILAEYGNTRV